MFLYTFTTMRIINSSQSCFEIFSPFARLVTILHNSLNRYLMVMQNTKSAVKRNASTSNR